MKYGLYVLSLARMKRGMNLPEDCPRLEEEFARFQWAVDRHGNPTGRRQDAFDHS